jgi:tetratricopeptide (TPR) repeat protein
MRAAIGIAPEDEHLRLYEQLGDCAIYGDAAVEAYQHALELWRESGQPDPLTGARLLRKLLIVHWYFASSSSWSPSQEEVAALQAEALSLAEQAADEDEAWRMRIAPLNPLVRQGSREDWEHDRDLSAAAVAYFERRQDWPALSLALDQYAGCALQLHAYEEAREASKRRLAWPQLPAWARGDVQNMISLTYFEQGDYDACIATMQSALAQVRPGDPLYPLAFGMGYVTNAAYLSGHWDELAELQQTLALMWDEMQQVPGLYNGALSWGSLIILLAALAREDHVAANALAALLERMMSQHDPIAPFGRSLVAAFYRDDPTLFDLDGIAQFPLVAVWVLLYFVEHDLPAPGALIEAAQKYRDRSHGGNLSEGVTEVAEVLASGDTIRLAAAIDAAEARHLVVFAARMRIVLAQRTGDASQLERARPVLERLGDRQFLRRLEEAEGALR